VIVQTGAPVLVKWTPEVGVVLGAASAGTAAMASAISDSTAMMPNFLIKVFLLYLVGLYSPLRRGGVYTPSP
jgi:hypothetical protein